MNGQSATGTGPAGILERIRELTACPDLAKLLAGGREVMKSGWSGGGAYDPETALDTLDAILAAVPLLLGALEAVGQHHWPRPLRPDERISWVPRRTPVLVCAGCRDDEGETTEWQCPTMDTVIARLTGRKARGE